MDKIPEDVRAELQTLFDRSARHIIKQGRPSFQGARCLYRTPDGCGCGAAPFIVKYDSSMEMRHENPRGGPWEYIITTFPEDHFDPVALRHVDFVTELQKAHDGVAGTFNRHHLRSFIADYRSTMRAVAVSFGLSAVVLEEVPNGAR